MSDTQCDFLDHLIEWADKRKMFHRYLGWHKSHLARCRVIWWRVLPAAIAILAVMAAIKWTGDLGGPIFMMWYWIS